MLRELSVSDAKPGSPSVLVPRVTNIPVIGPVQTVMTTTSRLVSPVANAPHHDPREWEVFVKLVDLVTGFVPHVTSIIMQVVQCVAHAVQ